MPFGHEFRPKWKRHELFSMRVCHIRLQRPQKIIPQFSSICSRALICLLVCHFTQKVENRWQGTDACSVPHVVSVGRSPRYNRFDSIFVNERIEPKTIPHRSAEKWGRAGGSKTIDNVCRKLSVTQL